MRPVDVAVALGGLLALGEKRPIRVGLFTVGALGSCESRGGDAFVVARGG